MSTYVQSLQERRAKTWNEAKALLDHADAQKRNLTAAEQQSYDRLTADLEEQRKQIDKLVADRAANDRAEEQLRALDGGSIERRFFTSPADAEMDEHFRHAIRTRSLEPIDVRIPVSEIRSGYQPGIEQRDLLTTSGSGLLGTSFWSQLQRHMINNSAILAAGATVITTETGETLKVPKTTAISTAAIVAEGDQFTESDPTLGSATFAAYKYGFLVQVSRELADDNNFDLLGFLAEQSGQAIGNAFGAHAINGTGSSQPNGILAQATLGNTGPTGTATSFGTQSTAGQGGDLLLDLQAALADPYTRSRSAAWLMRTATLNAIRKLKDSTGQYVFSTEIEPGSGASGTILGRPVFCDPNMPAIGASAKSVLFGDISKYWVRRVNGLRFERSDDFAFDRDLITFRAAFRLDGGLVDTSGAVKYFAHSAS